MAGYIEFRNLLGLTDACKGNVQMSQLMPMPFSILQEQKWRRQQGLDGLPPWTTVAEEALAEAMHNALQGLCFCAVKQ